MKDIPKLYMQMAALVFGAIISACAVIATWNITESISSIAYDIDGMKTYLADIDKSIAKIDDVHTSLINIDATLSDITTEFRETNKELIFLKR